mmetsp:Transcript_52725/g.127805  ORF Transcript_52725/g.127805 Transcript_52725/m.127805 type:complete len:219 (+) Transcript_52725:311-967(+)
MLDDEPDPEPFSSSIPSTTSTGRAVMTRYVPAGIRYDNRILRLDPNKSQTISIDSTQLATAPAVQKITIDVDNKIINEICATDSSSTSSSPSGVSSGDNNGCSNSDSSSSLLWGKVVDRLLSDSPSSWTVCSCDVPLPPELVPFCCCSCRCCCCCRRFVNIGAIQDRIMMSRAGMTNIGNANVIVTARHIRPTNNNGSFSSKSNSTLPEISPVDVQCA